MKMLLEEKDIKQAIIRYVEEIGLSPVENSISIDHDGIDYFAEVNLKD